MRVVLLLNPAYVRVTGPRQFVRKRMRRFGTMKDNGLAPHAEKKHLR